MQSIKKNLIYIILLICVVGAATFFGFKFLRSSNSKQASVTSPDQAGGFAQNGYGGGAGRTRNPNSNRPNFKPLHGTISSIQDQTIVMKADDGSSKNIICSSTTRIMEQSNGQRVQLAVTDLKVGDEINLMSSDTTQSNITAQMIFIGQFTMPQRGSGSWQGGQNSTGSTDNQGSASPAI